MPLIQYLTVDKTLNYRIKAKVGEQQFALDVRVTIKFQNPKIVSLQIKCAYAYYRCNKEYQIHGGNPLHWYIAQQNPSISKP